MKYANGQDIKLGDRVKLGPDSGGAVVCSLDTNEFNSACSQADWGYLQRGVLINFPQHGLIHYEEPEKALELIERSAS
ncbi:hypothetical protein [Paucibacter sp. XJ19-41]|uniref:hypothetical protein n=1 Tax=Paucibacter sp. XJ19-41 TaxID=2927824 RepID=UPI002349865C|nr:hypothetical protein [Paucibacter sp. XJ19-41]MDC6170553.1 hypothetical protein [Paucibacter sp. XJ19-41]